MRCCVRQIKFANLVFSQLFPRCRNCTISYIHHALLWQTSQVCKPCFSSVQLFPRSRNGTISYIHHALLWQTSQVCKPCFSSVQLFPRSRNCTISYIHYALLWQTSQISKPCFQSVVPTQQKLHDFIHSPCVAVADKSSLQTLFQFSSVVPTQQKLHDFIHSPCVAVADKSSLQTLFQFSSVVPTQQKLHDFIHSQCVAASNKSSLQTLFSVSCSHAAEITRFHTFTMRCCVRQVKFANLVFSQLFPRSRNCTILYIHHALLCQTSQVCKPCFQSVVPTQQKLHDFIHSPCRFSGVYGCDPPDGVAENAPKIYLSMGRKMYGFPKEHAGFRGSMGVSRQSGSQKMPLRGTSVWEAKCMDFLRKMQVFGGLWV